MLHKSSLFAIKKHMTYLELCSYSLLLFSSTETLACVFHTVSGLVSESEGVRFIRVREDAPINQEIILLQAYPRSNIYLKSAEGSQDHSYFGITELNSTTVRIILVKSLNDLVDRDIPRNLLKFHIVCSGENEQTQVPIYLHL